MTACLAERGCRNDRRVMVVVVIVGKIVVFNSVVLVNSVVLATVAGSLTTASGELGTGPVMLDTASGESGPVSLELRGNCEIYDPLDAKVVKLAILGVRKL